MRHPVYWFTQPFGLVFKHLLLNIVYFLTSNSENIIFNYLSKNVWCFNLFPLTLIFLNIVHFVCICALVNTCVVLVPKHSQNQALIISVTSWTHDVGEVVSTMNWITQWHRLKIRSLQNIWQKVIVMVCRVVGDGDDDRWSLVRSLVANKWIGRALTDVYWRYLLGQRLMKLLLNHHYCR